jgi:hypothetical protein
MQKQTFIKLLVLNVYCQRQQSHVCSRIQFYIWFLYLKNKTAVESKKFTLICTINAVKWDFAVHFNGSVMEHSYRSGHKSLTAAAETVRMSTRALSLPQNQ